MLPASSAQSPQSTFVRRSLVVASLDIGRVLADRNGVTFHAKGMCMYPTIHPGDVLSIQSRPAADILLGDIAVCRRNRSYLSCHRVVDKGKRDGRVYVVTRPDRLGSGMDEPAFDENLLGVVVAITRKGKQVGLQPAVIPLPTRWIVFTRIAWFDAAMRTNLRLKAVAGRLVNSVFYRLATRAWFALARPSEQYFVNVPLNVTLGDGVFRKFDPEKFDPRMEWKGKEIMRWTLALHLNGSLKPAARVTLVRCAESTDGWRIAESHVRPVYRGAGLDVALFRKVKTILTRCGQ